MTHSTSKAAFRLRTAMRSDVGMRRATNQDAVAIVPNDDSAGGDRFLIVADGMGAHAAGELASKMAVDHIPHAYLKSRDDSAPAALRSAVRGANERINEKGCSAHEFQGMGTTCTCLVASQGAVLAAHVGDSRLYRLRKGVLEQLTFDHSLVWEMAAASNVSEDKVPSCIPKNVITRSLGPHDTVNVDLEGPHTLEQGDVFLICSDGLSGVVDDPLAAGVLGALEPDDAAQTLIDLANLRGGPDNISVIVARAEETKGSQPVCKPKGEGLSALTSALLALVCLGGFGWFLVSNNPLGMLISAAGCGAAIVLGAVRKPASYDAAVRSLGGPYGNGPYRRYESGDGREAAEVLQALVGELAAVGEEPREELNGSSPGDSSVLAEQASLSGRLLVNWSPFTKDLVEADASLARGEYRVAIEQYAQLVRGVMRAVREDDGTHRYRAAVGKTDAE